MVDNIETDPQEFVAIEPDVRVVGEEVAHNRAIDLDRFGT